MSLCFSLLPMAFVAAAVPAGSGAAGTGRPWDEAVAFPPFPTLRTNGLRRPWTPLMFPVAN